MKNLKILIYLFLICSFIKPKSKRIFYTKEIKILVLIIASDNEPIYTELQKIWRLYMHDYPNNIEAYFIKCNPNLNNNYKIEGDVIWTKCTENLIPGILNKTILSMEAFLDRINDFDFVLRTNLSSFYYFPNLLKFLSNCPKESFYGGSDIGWNNKIGSGCGFIISSDVMKFLIKIKKSLINNTQNYDDVVLGYFLNNSGYTLTKHPRRDFYNTNDWHKSKNIIPHEIFHFRIKGIANDRITDDLYIHGQLLKKYYNKNYVINLRKLKLLNSIKKN